MTKQKTRVMWLLNHATLRTFEMDQLKAMGITEVFLPKFFPHNEGNLSANVDYCYDTSLTIPAEDLAILNAHNWYESPSAEAWEIANRHFQIAFIAFFPEQIRAASTYFEGALILRAFGLASTFSYTDLLNQELGPIGMERLKRIGNRFWFGAGYEHLKDMEGEFFKRRNLFLPVGLYGRDTSTDWTGNSKKILFVCPRIGSSPYFKAIYEKFVRDFSQFDYIIGGAQPVSVAGPKVIGFVPRAVHDANMRECAVMFYHSQEPNHIHYHPLEAIRAGMPLVFMADGLLDRMGGIGQPGRCRSIGEAQRKIRRILNGDQKLIDAIRKQQVRLLDSMRPENCVSRWQTGIRHVLSELEKARTTPRPVTTQPKRKRIAVLLPEEYRGGSLRGAILVACAIEEGSRRAGQPVDVVFGHRNNPALYKDEDFADLSSSIALRPFTWRLLNAPAAEEAMRYAGHDSWVPAPRPYLTFDDGIKQFYDCDLWVIISDRFSYPLLPLRPYIAVIYDYLQRYVKFLPMHHDQSFLDMAHMAERVLVTTGFTAADAQNYAGINPNKIRQMPMIAPRFPNVTQDNAQQNNKSTYFLWTTNASLHKNHENALLALRHYYEVLGGTLKCRVSGVNTRNLLHMDLPHLKPLADIVSNSKALKKNIRWRGDLPDSVYRAHLQNAAFLWHPARIDNGTFSVVEAAHLGVPALSSDYPAMREIDEQFGLNLSWMDSARPEQMARQLNWMEENADAACARLPAKDKLDSLGEERYPAYWQAVRECL